MNRLNEVISDAIKKQYPLAGTVTPATVAGIDKWEKLLLEKIQQADLPAPVAQFKFCSTRNWRSDLAYPEKRILIEVDGGNFGRSITCHQCHVIVKGRKKDGSLYPLRQGGRHATGKGVQNDAEKRNSALLLGYRPLTFVPNHIKDGYAVRAIAYLLNH